jgi:hypothetical protein
LPLNIDENTGHVPLQLVPEDEWPQRQHIRGRDERQSQSNNTPNLPSAKADDLRSQFTQLSGESTTFTRTADSGNHMKSHACGKCSCIMWVLSETKPGIKMIRTGTIDDQEVLDKMVPSKELYCSNRPQSFAEYPGIAHADKM